MMTDPTHRPLVTVAITACERADLFRICLRSVCAQTYRNLEIFVFDNSTTDNVENCVRELQDNRVFYSRNLPNVRDVIMINHNKALTPRNGQYHFVLSSDWALTEEALELMVRALQTDPGVCAVIADGYRLDLRTGKRFPRSKKLEGYDVGYDAGPHVRLDTHRVIRDAFYSLKGVGVAYHALIVSDILASGNLEKMYYSQASEQHLGLDLLLQKPYLAIIRKQLLISLENDQRYAPSKFRKHPRFAEVVARHKFLEARKLVLLSKDFNITELQMGLAWNYGKCMFQKGEQPLDSAVSFLKIAPSLAIAMCLAILCFPIGAIHHVITKSGKFRVPQFAFLRAKMQQNVTPSGIANALATAPQNTSSTKDG